MFTYKVVLPNSTYQIIEAESFSMTYDGISGMNAYFYVRKQLDEMFTWEEILVGYAHNPQTVQLDDNFVYQPPGSNANTNPIDKSPWAR